MSSAGGGELAGPLFGFTIASLLICVGIAFLPFAAHVSGWFASRLRGDGALAPLGGRSAADNMSPGNVLMFSIASIVIGAVIAWNAGGSVADGAPVRTASILHLVIILAGAVSLVGGAVVAFLSRSRARWRLLLTLGIFIMIGGCSMIALGAVTLLAAEVESR